MTIEAAVLPGYQARLVEIHAGLAQLRFGQMLAFAITCAALAAILFLGFLALTRGSVRLLPYSLAPLPVLVYSGKELRRRKSTLLQSVRLERFYERGIARLEGKWAGTGASGEEFGRSQHPYEQDLQVFGDGSLFELLCTCRTEIGRRCLANYLLDAPFLEEVKERQASANARKTLLAGFTTVRDVGSENFLDVGLRNAINAGVVPGPRMLVAVHALGATGGHCDDGAGLRFGLLNHEMGPEDGIINSPDQARFAVRFNIKYGADVIKTCATGGVLSPTDDVDVPQLSQAELDAIVGEAHELRRKTAAHAHGAEGAKRAIRAGIDSIEHGTFLDDEAMRMMRERGTYLVPTLATRSGLAESKFPPPVKQKADLAVNAQDGMVRRALQMGVKIALGTDAAVYPHGNNALEFVLMAAAGMTPAQSLRAGTSSAAALLGLSNKIGTLEAGKLADVVAVPGNPFENVRVTQSVLFVMKEGVIYRNDRARTP